MTFQGIRKPQEALFLRLGRGSGAAEFVGNGGQPAADGFGGIGGIQVPQHSAFFRLPFEIVRHLLRCAQP
jgi:hypothetical protein